MYELGRLGLYEYNGIKGYWDLKWGCLEIRNNIRGIIIERIYMIGDLIIANDIWERHFSGS